MSEGFDYYSSSLFSDMREKFNGNNVVISYTSREGEVRELPDPVRCQAVNEEEIGYLVMYLDGAVNVCASTDSDLAAELFEEEAILSHPHIPVLHSNGRAYHEVRVSLARE